MTPTACGCSWRKAARKSSCGTTNYLAETDAANDTQVVYTNERRRYGNLISQRRGSDSHWYHFDAIGSTRELTNASAVITDTRQYDVWGQIMAS